MRIVVGLGNPGQQYTNTRHNIAWLFLDKLLGPVNWQENKKFKALLYKDGETLFVKPLTFMNNSGLAVQKILSYYKLLNKNFIGISQKDSDLNNVLSVIHDDLDIDFTNYKITNDSRSTGHNGVKSIIKHLKTQKFTRWRIGIKNDLLRKHIPADKFVLSTFNSEERKQLNQLLIHLGEEFRKYKSS